LELRIVIRIYLLSVTGVNRNGISSALTNILSRHCARVLDIGQSVIHDSLSLGILIGLEENSEIKTDIETIEADCRKEFEHLSLDVRLQSISVDDYQKWVGQQGQKKHVLTLLAREISAEVLAEVTSMLASQGLDIYQITRLTGRIALEHLDKAAQACIEILVRGGVDDETEFQQELMELAAHLDVDLAYQRDDHHRRDRRLVVFDMDSTLIKQEVIDELAIEAEVGEEVSEVTNQAMRGEIDFDESLRKRVSLLAGLPESALQTVMDRLELNEGAEHLMQRLNQLGMKTAILSGGFSYFGEELKKRLNMDYLYANNLEIIDGKLTGQVLGEIVNGECKARLLGEIAASEGLLLDQVIAVGDGANDLPMLGKAGLGIAFHAKPLVRETASHSLSRLGLDAILYLMGYSDGDHPKS
jgi:phosphoserine phosphatase